jgi:transcriptional regulator with XRE-family HTH domain
MAHPSSSKGWVFEMSPEQCRAARAWLDWSQLDLAKKAGVSGSTIRDFEAGRRIPIANNLKAIRQALEEAGMHFLFSDHEPVGVAKRVEPPKKDGRKRKRS